MSNRFAVLAAMCMLSSMGAAPLAAAQPAPPPPLPPSEPVGYPAPPPPPPGADTLADPAAPPDAGPVMSGEPSVVTTPDGWNLKVSATNETQLPVSPLTTAVSSREYLVGGTFTGTVVGSGKTKLDGGALEVGYQIGCGIDLDKVELIGDVSAGLDIRPLAGPLGLGIGGEINVILLPGEVKEVSVVEKEFSDTTTRVTLKDVHISIDGCVGQSFLRSYAILTSSTRNNDDVIAYYGVTKAV
jgi:MspA